MASLRATWALATRLFANPFSLADNVASLKFGTANATRTASTASATISSMSVKPPEPGLPPCRELLPCRLLAIVGARDYLWMYQYVTAFGCSARADGIGLQALERRIGVGADDEGHRRAVVERHHAGHRGRRQAAADDDLAAIESRRPSAQRSCS